ncbi:MAG: ATPase domain-containing protein [Candidatus Micrarchaeia archaeon]
MDTNENGQNSDKIEKIPTYIDGLDKLIYGGIPKGSQVLISGGTGAGKTLMCMQILYNQAEKAGIPSAFISFEEEPKAIISNFKEAFPNLNKIDEFIRKGIISVTKSEAYTHIIQRSDTPAYYFGDITSEIDGIILRNNAQIIVIDPISLIRLISLDKLQYRKVLISILSIVKGKNVTGLYTFEMETPERKSMHFNSEFFIFDAVIAMYMDMQNERRTPLLEVLKTRGSKHSWIAAPYDIKDGGIEVLSVS